MASAIRLPPGVRDFLPQAAARRRAITGALLARFHQWGYQQIITPQFEVAEVLERGLGPQERRDTIRFIEPESGDVVALRPDITPQVARIAATRLGDVEGVLRLSYEGAVIRAGGARVQREILQAGIELIGAESPSGDAEAAALAAEVLLATKVEGARLEIGHVGPTQHALALTIDEPQRARLHDALARRDVTGAGAIAEELASGRDLVRALPRLTGTLASMERAADELGEVVSSALEEIRQTLEAAARLSPRAMDAIDVSIDLGEVRGFPYYTGVRLSGWLAGAGDAVLVGGRYDSLVKRYGRDRRATGFAVNVEAVAQAQIACGAASIERSGLVVGSCEPSDPDVVLRAQALATLLRGAGYRAALELNGLSTRESLVRYAAVSGLNEVLMVKRDGVERIDAAGKVRSIAESVVLAALDGKTPAIQSLIEGDQ